MSTRTLTIPYPDALPLSSGQSADEFEREMRFLLAAKLYELGRVSSGRAADIAGVSRTCYGTHFRRSRFRRMTNTITVITHAIDAAVVGLKDEIEITVSLIRSSQRGRRGLLRVSRSLDPSRAPWAVQ